MSIIAKSYWESIESRDLMGRKIWDAISENMNFLSQEQHLEVLIASMLRVLGYDLSAENIKDTPYRITKMYLKELLTSDVRTSIEDLIDSCTVFTNVKTDQYIPIKGIKYYSMCSHHFMPFMGKVNIAYHPNEKLLGLSKFPRIVKYFSRKAQLQESFTEDLADFINYILEPKGLLVQVSGQHTCVSARGSEAEMEVFTEAIRGEIDKQEVLSIWNSGV